MIGGILSVIDRLISLFKTRDERRQNLFQNVVDPLFGEIQTAYLEYVQALVRIRTAVESRTPFPDLLKEARELWAETAVLRHKVVDVATGYSEILHAPDIRDFVVGAPSLFGSLFDRSDFHQFVTNLEGIAWESQIWQPGQKLLIDHAHLSELLNSTLDTADRNWRSLCGEYGRLRAKYYEPTSIFLGQGKRHWRADNRSRSPRSPQLTSGHAPGGQRDSSEN